MKSAVLKIEERKSIGGSKVKRLRAEGYVPAVLYGKEMESIPVGIKYADFREAVSQHGRNAVFSAQLEDKSDYSVVIKDIQFDTVKNDLLHVDLQQVSLTERRESSVPVTIVGREKVETAAKMLIHHLDEIVVECLPQDTPSHIEADVSSLGVGDNFTAEQLNLPESVTLVTDPHEVIISLSEAKIMEEPKEEETLDPFAIVTEPVVPEE